MLSLADEGTVPVLTAPATDGTWMLVELVLTLVVCAEAEAEVRLSAARASEKLAEVRFRRWEEEMKGVLVSARRRDSPTLSLSDKTVWSREFCTA